MKPVEIEDDNVLDLGLGGSIYSKAQVEEFLNFQDSQGTRRAYLTRLRSWLMEDMEMIGPGDSS